MIQERMVQPSFKNRAVKKSRKKHVRRWGRLGRLSINQPKINTEINLQGDELC
jgi:hypothetical protein